MYNIKSYTNHIQYHIQTGPTMQIPKVYTSNILFEITKIAPQLKSEITVDRYVTLENYVAILLSCSSKH